MSINPGSGHRALVHVDALEYPQAMPVWLVVIFLFLLGISVGSFLNVVVWRLPRDKSLIRPGSHCPLCSTPLSWRDNIPVFGWILLRGRCRYCRAPISPRYPVVEFLTGVALVLTYWLLFQVGLGPATPDRLVTGGFGEQMFVPGGLELSRDAWLLALYLFMVSALIAASLIDAERMIIPLEIPWLMFVVGVVARAWFDRPELPGTTIPSIHIALMTLGATLGLIISIVLLRIGILKQSFAEGEPLLEHEKSQIQAGTLKVEDIGLPVKEYTRHELYREMRHEMLFLIPPMLLAFAGGFAALKVPAAGQLDQELMSMPIVQGAVGALLGAMVGALCVWLTRILGTFAFGKEAMGLGDVHLMFGVGAIIGAGPVVIAFFIAPVVGLPIALACLFFARQKQIPFGPYLAAGSVMTIFVYTSIADYLRPGLIGLLQMLTGVR
jgi:leader peptidase (prepilin peptidase) / N-methyltransferase